MLPITMKVDLKLKGREWEGRGGKVVMEIEFRN